MSLGLLVPSRGRPAQAARLAGQIIATATPGFTTTYFLLDHDDPELGAYLAELHKAPAGISVMITAPGGPRRMGPVLNRGATALAGAYQSMGFMGDDHWPRTPGWDTALTSALGGRPGVAYGNDLHQGERLPTACVMDSAIVRVLGYMSPPPLVHLWVDDFWRELGLALGNLAYRAGVLIEHRHPDAGKAPHDERYAATGRNPELMMADKNRWDAWREHVWPGDRDRLLDALAVTA